MRATLATLLFLLVLAGCAVDVPEVSVERLHDAIASPSAVVLDVRAERELSGELGQLEHAVNIPMQLLPDGIANLDEYRGDTLYVVCRNGNRSARAVAMLRSAGFTAFNVEGGMRAWRSQYGSAVR